MKRIHSGLGDRLLLIAGLASLAGTAISLIAFPAVPRQGDSFQYLIAAHWVLGEAEFTGANHPLAYPVFLALLIRLAGTALGPALLVVQHAIRLLPLILFGWLSLRYPRRQAVGFAAVLWALEPEGLVFAHYVMAEAVATGLAALAAVAILMHADRPSVRRGFVAGLAVAVLALFKSAALIWLIPLLFIRPASRRIPRRRIAGASVLGFAVVTMLAAGWFRGRTGSWALPGSLGEHLFSRVVSDGGALPAGDSGLATLNAMTGLAREAPAAQAWEYARVLDAVGVPRGDRDRIFLGLALRGLWHAPFRYLAGTVRGAAELAVWSPVSPADGSAYRVLEHRLPVPASMDDEVAELARFVPDADAAGWMLRMLGAVFDGGAAGSVMRGWVDGWRAGVAILRWPLILLMLAGMFSLWRDPTAGAPGRVAVVLATSWLLAHAAAEMPVPRFGIPVQPLLCWLGCEGAGFAFRSLAHPMRVVRRGRLIR